MPYSDSELEQIYGDLSPIDLSSVDKPQTPPVEDTTVPYRRLKQVGDILPKAVNSLIAGGVGIGQMLRPEVADDSDLEGYKNPIPTFDTGQTKGLTDFVLDKAAPEIVGWTVPYLGIGKVAKTFGAGATLAEGLAQGGANFLSSAKYSDSDPALSGGVGFGSGILQAALPRWQRALPLAAISSLEGFKNGNWLGAGANFIGNMLPGHLGGEAAAITAPVLEGNKFDNVAREVEAALQPNYGSTVSPGEFRFMDSVEASPQVTPDTTGDLFNQTGMRLGGENPTEQLPLRDMSPSNLKVNNFDFEPPTPIASTLDDISTAGLRLENEKIPTTQGEFGLVNLQGESKAPFASESNPGEFRFIDDVPITASKQGEAIDKQLFDPNFVMSQKQPSQLGLALAEQRPLGLPTPREVVPAEVKTPTPELTPKPTVIPEAPVKVESNADKITKLETRLGEIPKGRGTPNQLKNRKINREKIQEQIDALKKADTPSPTELPKATPLPNQNLPLVMSPTGELRTPPPRQAGPHIISTVLDEGDGQYLSGNKWNTPHQEGDSIFSQNIENASGMGKSAFLLQDENGLIRVTQDRMEAARIAEMAGQRANGKTGALQSQDLIDPVVKPEPQTVQQHRVAESVDDAVQLQAAKQASTKITELQQDYAFAKEEGDEVAARGIASAIAKMRKSATAGNAGAVTPQTLAIIAAGGVGGLIAYQQTKGDIGSTLAAAFVVAGLATLGSKGLKDLKGVLGPELKAPTVKVPSETIAEKLDQLAIDTLKTPAGLAVGGRGGIVSNALLGAEDFFGLNRLQFYKDVKVKAGGFVDDILHQQHAALKAVAKIRPSDSFSDATAQFLRGQLNDPVEVQRLLTSGGIVSSESGAWSKLSATEKAKYPEKWLQLDDQLNTNTKGDGVAIWHVTNSVKQQLVQGEKDALMRLASTPDDLKFAEYAMKTRENFDTLMQTIHAAAGPKEARRLIGTMGQYMTRSHALITDPKFYPDDKTIQLAMNNLASAKTDSFLSSVDAGFYKPPAGSAGKTISVGGKNYTVSDEAANMFDNLYTPESLRAVVTQQIKEIKSYGDSVKKGLVSNDNVTLQGGLFTGRKELDAVRQTLLGTYGAPQEMIRATFNKLLPAAHSAHAMLGLTAAKEASGLPGRFSTEIEYNSALNALRDSLPLAPNPHAQRAIQNQLNELTAYLPISTDNASMGLFQGSFVSRHVYSQLDEILNPFGALSGVMGTGLKKFNDLFKETHLIWNPVVQARNAVQVPFMLVMGRAAHDVTALQTAYDIVFKDHTSDIARWAIQNGAMSGNPVKGEFNFNMRELLDGSADNQIFGMFQKTRQFLHLAYSKPDDFVRSATFIAAARREAKALGIPEDKMHLDQRVTDAARIFMNRRTMDYSNVPKWVKVGRTIPLLSPFLTYAHEIARVTKNMAIDAAKGDLVSGAGLAGLSVLPFLAQSQAEASLSPEDAKAWKQAQAAAQDYSRPRFKIPVSRNSDGTFNYYDITPIMPFGDYLMMGRSIASGDAGSALAVNPLAGADKSPLLNLAASQIQGKDIHTQREFRDGWDRAKNVLQAITPPPTPGIGQDAARDYPEWLGGRIGQTNVKTGRTYTIKGAIMRNLLGADESQVNADMAVQTMVKVAQHDIANERQYLNDALRSQGISAEAKQRAIDRYAAAVKAITDQIHQRLNP